MDGEKSSGIGSKKVSLSAVSEDTVIQENAETASAPTNTEETQRIVTKEKPCGKIKKWLIATPSPQRTLILTICGALLFGVAVALIILSVLLSGTFAGLMGPLIGAIIIIGAEMLCCPFFSVGCYMDRIAITSLEDLSKYANDMLQILESNDSTNFNYGIDKINCALNGIFHEARVINFIIRDEEKKMFFREAGFWHVGGTSKVLQGLKNNNELKTALQNLKNTANEFIASFKKEEYLNAITLSKPSAKGGSILSKLGDNIVGLFGIIGGAEGKIRVCTRKENFMTSFDNMSNRYEYAGDLFFDKKTIKDSDIDNIADAIREFHGFAIKNMVDNYLCNIRGNEKNTIISKFREIQHINKNYVFKDKSILSDAGKRRKLQSMMRWLHEDCDEARRYIRRGKDLEDKIIRKLKYLSDLFEAPDSAPTNPTDNQGD